MISVFLAFVLGEDASTKMFGLGLATAILVDATLVRMVLVPATMTLLGDANWWIPEGAGPTAPAPAPRGRRSGIEPGRAAPGPGRGLSSGRRARGQTPIGCQTVLVSRNAQHAGRGPGSAVQSAAPAGAAAPA